MSIAGFTPLGAGQGILTLPRLAPYLQPASAKAVVLSVEDADQIIGKQRKKIASLNAELAQFEGSPDAPDTADWDPFPDMDDDDDDDFESPQEKLEEEIRERENTIDLTLRRSGRVMVYLTDPREEGIAPVQEAAIAHLIEQEETFVSAVQEAVLDCYKEFYSDEYWRNIASMKPVDSFEQLVGRFHIGSMEITRWETERAFVLVHLHADWEDDHGLYIIYREGEMASWATADNVYDEVASDPVEMADWETQANNPAAQLYQAAIDAAMEKDIRTLKRLIEEGVDLNYPDPDSYSPLWHAINEYDVKTVRFLLENGADPTRREDGKTALGTARELFQELSWTEKPKGLLMKGAALLAKMAGGGGKGMAGELKALREIIHLLEERVGLPKTDF
jgi:hypothetical protein